MLLRRGRERRSNGDAMQVPAEVAPGNPCLGLMLPYTALHHLLLDAMDFQPLVMTSGNRSGEPIAYEDAGTFDQLGDIADLFLVHDRSIQVRCDDSVTRIVDRREAPIRRSRGYSPRPIDLAITCRRPLLAVGGQLKSTFALGRARAAIISHHLGDLDNYQAHRAFQRDIELYERLFEFRPELIVHDLHPDYASTGYARPRRGPRHSYPGRTAPSRSRRGVHGRTWASGGGDRCGI